MNENAFWCVWRENGGSPTVKHMYRADAVREAQRLAMTHPGQRFVVLMATSAYRRQEVIETLFDTDDMMVPF